MLAEELRDDRPRKRAERVMILSARRAGGALLRSRAINRAVRALAGLRGHRLVLVYHRVGPPAPAGCGVVPSVSLDTFRAQMQVLCEHVDLVALDAVIPEHQRERNGGRPRVAVTFDDDLPSHVDVVLPVLREMGLPATFFLSGRALHRCGPYWFQHLEAVLIAYGPARGAALLGLPNAPLSTLVVACEKTAALRKRATELAAHLPAPPVLDRDAIVALVTAGMAIGFHTLEHESVPEIDDETLDKAVARGRDALANAAGAAVRYFAYPYGKADTRSAAAVRRAGFQAAFTGQPRPVRFGDDPYRLGRWEPGPLAVDDLLVKLAVRLHRHRSLSLRRSFSWT